MENDAVVIPGLRIRDVLIARAEAPQPQDSDCDSDGDASFSDDDHGSNSGDNSDDQPIAPSASPPPLTKRTRPHDFASLDRTDRKKLKKKLAHRERRREQRETNRDFTPSRPKAVSIIRIRQSDPLSIPIQYAQHTRPVASTSWMGLRDSAIQNAAAREAPDETPAFVLPEARPYTLEEILDPEMHMVLVNWDGTPTPVVDEDRVVFALLGGRPRETERWQEEVAAPAAELVEEAAVKIFGADAFYSETYGDKLPRRGSFHGKTSGASLGGGQKQPTAFFHAALTLLTLAQLFSSKPFQRIAGFVNTMFQLYAPDLHEYYRSMLQLLHKWKESLPRNFDEFTSVFAAATMNFGPCTITLPHLDFANLAWGWCAITALGDFDPDKGGHLILWDLRLVIRFPPGCSILIPSAILRHSNVSIQQGEKRFSFTQYTAAGIFRFVYNGFKTEKTIDESQLPKAERVRRAQDRADHWAEGMKMYKKWDFAFE
ncbi:hypothetical protein B0H11DRAFT_2262169 [Mycena galericulata]|nr:hypothetical protein B0H11DRAFT_2262169 [Mycena galericulata]